jgi:zinc/manganese transport system substrate-binding protein
MVPINFNQKQNMKKTFILILLTSLAPFMSQAKLNVVTTLPDLGALAREVGGDDVEVTTLGKPMEDPHFVDAKPSFIVKLNHADALIEGGAELEMGWLPPLLESARNSKLQIGSPGRIVASDGIQLLDIPASVSRAQGDIHAMGNPHFLVDPIRAGSVAIHIADAFSKLDPASASRFEENLKTFNHKLETKMKEWSEKLSPYHGQSVAAYHDSWVYFADRFGLKIDVFLEPKPGIPPSPSHLASVIEKIKSKHVKAILVEPYHNRKIAESVASHTGAQVVDVAQYPGGIPDTKTYFELMDSDISRLANALK